MYLRYAGRDGWLGVGGFALDVLLITTYGFNYCF